MENNLIAQLEAAGIDTEGALRRFCGNAGLYERFMSKFGDDPSYLQIKDSVAQQNWDSLLTAAHTLKGVAGNLGMTRLYTACSEIVDILRAGQFEQVSPCFEELQAAYRQVIGLLPSK